MFAEVTQELCVDVQHDCTGANKALEKRDCNRFCHQCSFMAQ